MTQVLSAGAVIVGNEILSAKVVDENGPYLIKVLRGWGIAVGRLAMVPDVVDDIADEVLRQSARFDAVFTSGGIGPTHDDVTIEGLAAAFHRPVVRHPDLVAIMRAHLGAGLTEAHLRMAEVPEGAELVRTATTWMPTVRIANVYVLPGPPVFFRDLLLALRGEVHGGSFTSHAFYLLSNEVDVADLLRRVERGHAGVLVGSYPRFDQADHRLRVTVEGRDPGAVAAACSELRRGFPAGDLVREEALEHAAEAPRE